MGLETGGTVDAGLDGIAEGGRNDGDAERLGASTAVKLVGGAVGLAAASAAEEQPGEPVTRRRGLVGQRRPG